MAPKKKQVPAYGEMLKHINALYRVDYCFIHEADHADHEERLQQHTTCNNVNDNSNNRVEHCFVNDADHLEHEERLQQHTTRNSVKRQQ